MPTGPSGIDEWEDRKMLDWLRRGMLRPDGILRSGCFPKFRGPLPKVRHVETVFEIGARKLRLAISLERYRRSVRRYGPVRRRAPHRRWVPAATFFGHKLGLTFSDEG